MSAPENFEISKESGTKQHMRVGLAGAVVVWLACLHSRAHFAEFVEFAKNSGP